MQKRLAWLFVALLCVSWVCAEEAKATTEPAENTEEGDVDPAEFAELRDEWEGSENETMMDPRKMEFHSLFEHNCSYMSVENNESEGCSLIQLTPNYNVEVMLPVYSKALNMTLFVPFLVRSGQKDTTFSRKTLAKFRVDNQKDNLTIIEDEYPAIPGEENILGVSFLDSSLLAIDFYSYEAGMLVNSRNKGVFTLNWPLDAFKDKQLEQKAAAISQKHRSLKKEVRRLQDRTAAKLSDLRKLGKKKEQTIARLQQHLAAVKANYSQQAGHNGTTINATSIPVNIPEEIKGTTGNATTAPDTEPETDIESDTDDDDSDAFEDPEADDDDEEPVKPKKKAPSKPKKNKMKVDL
jgi:hypothetical protein